MSSFAGFRNLEDYIETRCREKKISMRQAGEALGRGHAYLSAIAKGRYTPSPAAADEVAEFFGDNPRIVRILAGLELPPTDEDKIVFEIREIAASLSRRAKTELLEYANFLKSKYARQPQD